MIKEKNVREFDSDVKRNKGYLYTTGQKLSCQMSNRRLSESIADFVNLKEKVVIDIGCGDGTYTFEFLQQKPVFVMGIDASKAAIKVAQEKTLGRKNIKFQAMDVYKIGLLKKKFDIAIVRGLLHHLDDPKRAIKVISKIAPIIVVIEPNGYNPILKVLEKISTYHVKHGEKSYLPLTLNQWFKENGREVARSDFRGLVPFFCPDWMAKILKFIEPVVEQIPLLKNVSCAVYVFRVSVQ